MRFVRRSNPGGPIRVSIRAATDYNMAYEGSFQEDGVFEIEDWV